MLKEGAYLELIQQVFRPMVYVRHYMLTLFNPHYGFKPDLRRAQ